MAMKTGVRPEMYLPSPAAVQRYFDADLVDVLLPGLDRPGLLHVPTMCVIPPLSGADDGDDGSADKDDKGDADKDADKDKSGDADKDDDAGDDDDKITKDDDWQIKSRKNESRAKKAETKAAQVAKERDELAKKLAKIEESNLSAQEKAIKVAREEAALEVTSRYETERRADRIEGMVTKLALTGFKVKDGDKTVTLKFADPDDAQLRLDRALRNEDITYDEIYADGKVKRDALTTFLTEVLEEHPRLRAEDGNGNGRELVDMDGGKGSGSGRKSLEDMTPDEHLKEVQGR